ncbi:hypothetical protein C8A03DRAFT_39188 [Achaetomium macrosporum]|uniref:Uncharacterized protein n=1 Tax=Achaetomium macrosporum TaxID=79813 RepID=A0AAN7C1J9_9PEZI|nr:hypothetical protein C8A03DRAFT_39188 [Achaetomium macrosporum]
MRYVKAKLMAPFVVSQACLPYMEQHRSKTALHHRYDDDDDDHDNGGRIIIFTSSFRALRSDFDQEGYACEAKAGRPAQPDAQY